MVLDFFKSNIDLLNSRAIEQGGKDASDDTRPHQRLACRRFILRAVKEGVARQARGPQESTCGEPGTRDSSCARTFNSAGVTLWKIVHTGGKDIRGIVKSPSLQRKGS